MVNCILCVLYHNKKVKIWKKLFCENTDKKKVEGITLIRQNKTPKK